MSVVTSGGGGRWHGGAIAQGFTPAGDGDQLHRIGMAFRLAGGRGTLSHPVFTPGTDLPALQMGRPGLWRLFASGCAEFDFPSPDVLAGSLAFADLLDWAIATADGRLPGQWGAPSLDEVRAAAGEARLLVRSGAQVVSGEFRRESNRLALVFPEILPVPGDLSSARRAWVARLTGEAQRRWRLVRIGPDATGDHLQAELDLTGAPHHALDALVSLGITSLCTVIEWILPSLRLAADPTVSSEIFETQPPAGNPAERTT